MCSELKWERGRNINGRRREDNESERESEGGKAVGASKGGRLTEMRVFIGGGMSR